MRARVEGEGVGCERSGAEMETREPRCAVRPGGVCCAGEGEAEGEGEEAPAEEGGGMGCARAQARASSAAQVPPWAYPKRWICEGCQPQPPAVPAALSEEEGEGETGAVRCERSDRRRCRVAEGFGLGMTARVRAASESSPRVSRRASGRARETPRSCEGRARVGEEDEEGRAHVRRVR